MDCVEVTWSDLDKLQRLQPEGWPDLTRAFSLYCTNDFCYPVKVVLDNRIVGIGASICYATTGWLAHIIVDKEYRKRGIGFYIVTFLLNALLDKGIKTVVLIATELGLPVYEKAGFHRHSEYLFLKKLAILEDNSPGMHVYPYQDSFYQQILDLDRLAVGEIRRSLLEKHLHNSLVYLQGKSVRGYYIPDLGEGPVIAVSREAAEELLRSKLAAVDRIVIPEGNQTGINLLLESGFALAETRGVRMIYGPDICWRPDFVYSRIGGNFG